ncbi:MAG: Asp-tRNA(Asn)/Glu-tRNA(Gln) amidotransferase subunit GatC [Nanoarchaeota archaeon]
MEISKETIQKVAKNARLELTEQEIKEFLPQIKEVINAFSKLKKAPSNNLEPSFQPIEVKNITREDKTKSCLTQEQALQNTEHKKEGYFKGPKTLG